MQPYKKPETNSPKVQRQKAGGPGTAGHKAPTPHARFTMRIFVKDTLSSAVFPFALPATSTVAQLKALVYSTKRNIHPDNQRLSFGNSVLEDGRSLSDYNISHESTVMLRYGLKFPFAWRAPPELSPEDFELPAEPSEGHANVSTILGGSTSVNEKPFSPMRSFVPNVQVCALLHTAIHA